MPTLQQIAAVEKLVEIGGTSVSRAMRESKMPYSPQTAKVPGKLTKSKGFKELMKQYGLTEGLIAKALVSDIKNKPGMRTPELRLGAEILKMSERNKPDTPPVNNNFIQININRPINAENIRDKSD